MGSTKDDVYPPDPETMKIFEAIGGAIGVEACASTRPRASAAPSWRSPPGFTRPASGGCWKTAWSPLRHGPTYPGLTFGIAAAALASPGIPLDDVRRHYSTVGGINEQCYAAVRDRGGVAALEADAVLERVRATPTESTLDGGAP
jgi:pyrroline-5-carboxylate reductase